jgi:hypothetical protein
MADRYNISKTRLAKLKTLARNPNGRITSKQHREMKLLECEADMVSQDLSLQSMLKIIAYIEHLQTTESATDGDLARLMVLKHRLLDE